MSQNFLCTFILNNKEFYMRKNFIFPIIYIIGNIRVGLHLSMYIIELDLSIFLQFPIKLKSASAYGLSVSLSTVQLT